MFSSEKVMSWVLKCLVKDQSEIPCFPEAAGREAWVPGGRLPVKDQSDGKVRGGHWEDVIRFMEICAVFFFSLHGDKKRCRIFSRSTKRAQAAELGLGGS